MNSVQENSSAKPSKKKAKNKRKQCIENGTGTGSQTDRLSEKLKENVHITTGNSTTISTSSSSSSSHEQQQNGIDSHHHLMSPDYTKLRSNSLTNGEALFKISENGHESRLNCDCNISSRNSPKESNNCHSNTNSNGELGKEEFHSINGVDETKAIITNGTHISCRSTTPSPQPQTKEIEKHPNEGQDCDKNKIEKLLPVIAQPALDLKNIQIEYKEYESELQMHDIMRLIQAELSEPYSIYTYRYFIYNWPKLCFLAAHGNEYVGAIVCKLDMHVSVKRGYIAMLAVRREYRKLKIGTTLVQKAIEAMLEDNADEVVLETEMRNIPALRLYENLGFVRDKRLFRYYLNGVDALRLKLWFR